MFKKFLIITMMIGFSLLFTGSQDVLSTSGFVPVVDYQGNPIYYRGSNVQVEMPATYQRPNAEFRGVWVTPLTGDISSFTSMSQYKAEMMRVFDVMEFFQMNAMIFHVRIMNDALYQSELNPWSQYYSRNPSWDALPWIIEECHKRGIEFHAWLNPYRVRSSGWGGTMAELAATFPSYNIASNPAYLLPTSGGGVILNPGEPAVRTFLIDTVMEIVENYNVDAIHFDDYFYARMVGTAGTITQDPDQSTYLKYKSPTQDGASWLDKSNWRREQVDIFIRDLYHSITDYNLANDQAVQLGISPSGIYRNGNGVVTYDNDGHGVSNGSNSSGFSHYDFYLFADTMKWVREGWIDYLVPQVYWAFDNPSAPFADITSWWSKMFKNEKVNLYLGLGLYANVASGNTYGWKNNPVEAETQMQYLSQFPEFNGTVVFSFQHLSAASGGGRAFSSVKDNIWNKPTLLPEIRSIRPITPTGVRNLAASVTDVGYRLDWEEGSNSTKYAIYRNEGAISYNINQLIAVVGDIAVDGKISFIDATADTSKNYTYGIRAMSRTNTLSIGRTIQTAGAPAGELLSLGTIDNIITSDNKYVGEQIKVRFDTMHPIFGGAPTYEVFTSTNLQNWYKVTSPNNPVTSTALHSVQNLVLSDSSQVYIKITARNSIGYSESEPITIRTVQKYAPIRHFTYLGKPHNEESVTFQWWEISNKNLMYRLQYSTDELIWTDITTVDNPVRMENGLVKQDFTFPETNSRYFYRVIAEDSLGNSISQSLRIDTIRNLGAFENMRFNGEIIDGPIYVDENDRVQITWNNLEGSNINYITRISTDLKNWRTTGSPHLFSAFVDSSVSGVTTQNFTVGYLYYTLYLRVEAISPEGSAFSEVIEMVITLDYHYLDDLLLFILNEQNAQFNRMNIFG